MKVFRTFSLVLVLCLLPLKGMAQHPSERLFYYTDSQDSWESLQRNIESISILAPGGYSVDEDGVVWGG
ncbi:MAG TPA: hypothetical protein VFI91_00080, partial [Longimicrobiaceae bacterium]|nr:hypothetical protein [Longimicrobiaceae bacterium]